MKSELHDSKIGITKQRQIQNYFLKKGNSIRDKKRR